MTRRRWLALLMLGFVGYAALFALFPRFAPASRWGYQLSRGQAIAKAREAAARFRVDTAGWRAAVTAEYNRQVEYYLARQPHPVAASLLSPVKTSVVLSDLRAGRSFRAEFNASGRIVTVRSRDPEPPAAPAKDEAAAQAAKPEASDEEAQLTAEAAVKDFLGPEYPYFLPAPEIGQSKEDKTLTVWVPGSPPRRLSEISRSKEGSTFTWTAEAEPRLRLSVAAQVAGATVKELTLRTDFTQQFQDEFAARRSRAMKFLSDADPFLGMPAIFLGLIFYFVALGRRRVRHRLAFIFLGVVLLFLLLTNGLGGFADQFRSSTQVSNPPSAPWLGVLLYWLLFTLVLLLFAGALYFFWAAGQALAAGLPSRRTLGLELLLRGKLLTRQVAGNVAAGLLLGGLVSAIPYLIRASGLFRGAEINSSGLEDFFTAPLPALGAPASAQVYSLFVLFGFLVPLLDAHVPKLWLARVLSFVAGCAWLAVDNYFYLSASAAIATAALLMLAYHGVYRRFDLLAVIFAVMTAETATSAASLLAQPSAPLRAAGAYALVTLGVLLALALVGAWRGREVPQEFFEAADQAASRAARERLRAEFDVARRAQEQMLPSAPPALPGYQIAATCQPAKEVGGDLYDFLPLLDGRLGIVVADVSGKGVPASLYMTLTKGLLASVAEERVDPGEILREVNRHLYEVCRQKIFVTVFLGVIDPVARTLTYARAGHNPPVWHRAALASATLLRAPGLGLGLNGGQLFNRILAVERIRLEPDDTLFFYSDGITEAMNASGEPYGEERLLAIAARTDGLGAEAARDAVLADVGAFLGETPPQDDQTLVVVRVNTDSISERLLVR